MSDPYRTLLLTCILVNTLVPPASAVSKCDQLGLVKCFLKAMNDYGWHLFDSKQNPAAPKNCTGYDGMHKCMSQDFKCTVSEKIENSRVVSDLMAHRHHAGSFLRSYYLMSYACTAANKKDVEKQHSCLQKEHIGKNSLYAANYIEHKLRKDKKIDVHKSAKVKEQLPFGKKETGLDKLDKKAACNILKTQLDSIKRVVDNKLCGGVAQKLICNSLFEMFTKIYSESFVGCKYECTPTAKSTDAGSETAAEKQEVSNTGTQKLNGGAQDCRLAFSTAILLICVHSLYSLRSFVY